MGFQCGLNLTMKRCIIKLKEPINMKDNSPKIDWTEAVDSTDIEMSLFIEALMNKGVK